MNEDTSMYVIMGIIGGVLISLWFLFLQFQEEFCDFFNIDINEIPDWMYIPSVESEEKQEPVIVEKKKPEVKSKEKSNRFTTEYDFNFSSKKENNKSQTCHVCGTRMSVNAYKCPVCGTLTKGAWDK